jgi:predicted nucleic acid-binding protein
VNPWVVDTSVVFKWFRQEGEEECITQALALLDDHLAGRLELHAPDLLLYELGNILSLKEDAASEEAVIIVRDTLSLGLTIHPIGLPLTEETFNVARQYGVTFYDASFLALSRLLGCPLVTADNKLYRKARSFAKLTLLGNL